MRKYSVMLLALLVVMFLGISTALADPACNHSYVKNEHGGEICQYCFSDRTGKVHAVYWDRYEVNQNGHREVFYCMDCNVEWKTSRVAHTYDQGTHGGKICTVCYADRDGRFHQMRLDSTEYENSRTHTIIYVCDVCGEEWYRQAALHSFDPMFHSGKVCEDCRHDLNGRMHFVPHRGYEYYNENSHAQNSMCATCGDSWMLLDSHWYGGWHNGEVCMVCFRDAAGQAHRRDSAGRCYYCDGYLNVTDGYYYVRNEKTTKTGLVPFNGGLFYVMDGKLQSSLNGLTLIDSTFYFLANGMVQQHNGFALYDGEWFYLNGGTLDTTASGVYPYDGAVFLIAAGRLVDEYTGFAQVPSGEWYLVAEGRVVTEFTGVATWLGELFEIRAGQMIRWIGPASGN